MRIICLFFLLSLCFACNIYYKKSNITKYKSCDYDSSLDKNISGKVFNVKLLSVLIFDKSIDLRGFYKGVIENNSKDTFLIFDDGSKGIKGMDFNSYFLSDLVSLKEFQSYKSDTCVTFSLPNQFIEQQKKYYPRYKLLFGQLILYYKL